MLDKVWKDQAEFNRNFFPKAHSFEEQSRQTKEFSLCLMSEASELLKAINWKVHRKHDLKANPEHIKNEMTDILKYWISLCIVWNISPEEAIADYWRKSMVCRQRYSEEFVHELDGQIVLCDIDGILADYFNGFLQWVISHRPSLAKEAQPLIGTSVWLDSKSLGIDEQVWQELKHEFRTSRGKVGLPVYPGSKDFLESCKAKGYKVVLLTSRPIDKYPNIYTDTLEWLNNHSLTFDAIWWAVDKKETVLSKSIRKQIVFAIDDDPKYIDSYLDIGVPAYWVHANGDCRNLQDLTDLLKKGGKL